MSVTENDLRIQMEGIFAQIDTNQNGKLEYNEVKVFSQRVHEMNNPG